jgi:alcohol dehydrogenase
MKALGVHGKSVELHLERLWAHNITLRTRLVDTVTTPMLLKAVVAGTLDPRVLITHRFRLDEIERAYAIFGNAAKERALKVVLASD